VLRGLDCFTIAGIAAIWHHTERGIWEIVPHIPQLAPSSFSKPIKDSPCSTTPQKMIDHTLIKFLHKADFWFPESQIRKGLLEDQKIETKNSEIEGGAGSSWV
jgi:hypothetical protein